MIWSPKVACRDEKRWFYVCVEKSTVISRIFICRSGTDFFIAFYADDILKLFSSTDISELSVESEWLGLACSFFF